jgi:hypothetical protein
LLVVVLIISHKSPVSALIVQGLLNQEADFQPLSDIWVDVDKIIEQAVAEKEGEEETVGIGMAIKSGVLNEDGHDDGDSHQEAIGRYSIEIEKGLAPNEKVVTFLDKILAVSGCIALSDSR